MKQLEKGVLVVKGVLMVQARVFWSGLISCSLGLSTVCFAQTGQVVIPIPGVTPDLLNAKQTRSVGANSPMHEKLQRQWIVRSVRRDGAPNAAQIGQQVGDVITIKKDDLLGGIAFG